MCSLNFLSVQLHTQNVSALVLLYQYRWCDIGRRIGNMVSMRIVDMNSDMDYLPPLFILFGVYE